MIYVRKDAGELPRLTVPKSNFEDASRLLIRECLDLWGVHLHRLDLEWSDEMLAVIQGPSRSTTSSTLTTRRTRYSRIGFSGTRLLFVVFTLRAGKIRIIHARKAGRLMEKIYAKHQPG